MTTYYTSQVGFFLKVITLFNLSHMLKKASLLQLSDSNISLALSGAMSIVYSGPMIMMKNTHVVLY